MLGFLISYVCYSDQCYFQDLYLHPSLPIAHISKARLNILAILGKKPEEQPEGGTIIFIVITFVLCCMYFVCGTKQTYIGSIINLLM